jgi:uncharacterized lipoprotein YddW (UPF0748 family)
MELHAWVWMFAAANQRHNALLNQPANYPGPVLSRLIQTGQCSIARGVCSIRILKRHSSTLPIPEVRNYLTWRCWRRLPHAMQVDGIQLDYIRYPFQDPSVNQTYGYSQVARQQFQGMTGVDPIKVSPTRSRLWQKWTDFRIRQIDSFVALSVSKRPTDAPRIATP